MSDLTRVYFGHHKCASRYLRAVCSQTAYLLGWSVGKPTQVADLYMIDNAAPEELQAVQAAGPFRGFHVIRDPRDIVVSGYFSHLHSHPIFREGDRFSRWRAQLAQAATVEEGLLLEMDFEAKNFANIANWNYDNANIYETRFEQLVVNPPAVLADIFAFLAIPIVRTHWLQTGWIASEVMARRLGKRPQRRRASLPHTLFAFVLWRNSFQRKAGGRRPGEEDLRHHYRKGMAGDWHNHFTPRVVSAFKERYNDLLIDLGYESSPDW